MLIKVSENSWNLNVPTSFFFFFSSPRSLAVRKPSNQTRSSKDAPGINSYMCCHGVRKGPSGSACLIPLPIEDSFSSSVLSRFLVSIFRTPFAVLLWYRESKEVEDAQPEVQQRAQQVGFAAVVYVTTCSGLFLAFTYFMHFLIPFARSKGYELLPKHKWAEYFSTTSEVVGSARLKRAGTRKVNGILINARAMHRTTTALEKSDHPSKSFLKSESDGVFQNYTLRGERFEETGSFFWVWSKIISGELFDAEGIWLPARLIIFQFAQVGVAMLTFTS